MKRITLLLAGYLCIFLLFAQPIQKLPMDPDIRFGKLENGLTYYIKHNEEPKNRIEFQIAQRVGSMQEEDNQRGLAHFLEHVAFSSLEHFPTQKGMLEYLQSRGLSFGGNINAYTSLERTVYNISNVPIDQKGLIDSCLWILYDWSNGLLLKEEDIDKERGIIREEWRTRTDANMRILEELLPRIYPGSKYGSRLPIGIMEVIDNFTYKELRDYYHKWYHPGNQAIVIVGDFDTEQMEQLVKERFSKIPKAKDAAPIVAYEVPDNVDPIVAVITDKEASSTDVSIYFKHDPIPAEMKGTVAEYAGMNIAGSLIARILNERFQDVSHKPNTPINRAYGNYGIYFLSRTKDAFCVEASAKEGKAEEALQLIYREALRAARFGFMPSELERAKKSFLSAMEKTYNERSNRSNRSIAAEIVRNYTEGESMPGIEMEFEMTKQIIPAIDVKVLNDMMQSFVSDTNRVIYMLFPEKEGMKKPAKEEILTQLKSVDAETLEPLKEESLDKPLISVLPQSGKVKKESKDVQGNTVWQLSNGIKVVFRTNDFKKDEINLKACSYGGMSLYKPVDYLNYRFLNSFNGIGGLGEFNVADLSKVLAGKVASTSLSFTDEQEVISGSSSVKDFETMLQLVYLQFTGQCKDSEAYLACSQMLESSLKQQEANPIISLIDTLNKVAYENDPRSVRLRADDLRQIDYDRMFAITNERLANPADFTFFFVGNIDPVTAKPLIERYLGGLKTTSKKEKVNPKYGVSVAKGVRGSNYEKVVVTPMTTILMTYSGQTKADFPSRLEMSFLTSILDIVYTDEIREKKSGTYGVSASGWIDSYPAGQASVQIYFDTNRDQATELKEIVKFELEKVAKEGPRQDAFEKVMENELKTYQEAIRTNGYWMNALTTYHMKEEDIASKRLDMLKAITPERIQKFTADLLKQGNYIEIIQNGINSK